MMSALRGGGFSPKGGMVRDTVIVLLIVGIRGENVDIIYLWSLGEAGPGQQRHALRLAAQHDRVDQHVVISLRKI